MMPAAKMFDPILGIDVHIVQPPGPVPPVPLPHPHTGLLFDPFDLAPYIGSTVSVGGLPRAVAGTGTELVPAHIPLGVSFVKPPANDSELLMGSATVTADGDPFSYLGLPLLSCWDVGMPPIPRPPRSLLPSLVLPTTVVLSVPSGVTVGGAPTVSLTALAGRVGLGPLMALYSFATTGNPLALIGLAGPAMRGMKFLNKKLKFIKKSKCGRGVKLFNGKLGLGGDPVDLVSGAQLCSADDYVEPEGLFRLCRYYSSARRDEAGPLGYGFTHTYAHSLELFPQRWRYRDPEDVQVDFDPLVDAHAESNESGMVLRRVGAEAGIEHVELRRRDQPRLRFALPAERRRGRARLVEVRDERHALELRYRDDRLVAIVQRSLVRDDAPAVEFAPRYDERGRWTELWRSTAGERERVCAYAYASDRGLLVGSVDAEGRRSRYEYDAARTMTARVDPGGYRFTWAYDERGRCVETAGQDGLHACRLEYEPDQRQTHRWQQGQRFTYRYDGNGRITERVAPDGSTLVRELDDAGNVVHERNSDGRAFRWLYDEHGAHYAREDEFGHVYPPELDAPVLPDPIAPTWPDSPIEREAGRAAPAPGRAQVSPELVRRLPDAAQSMAEAVMPLASASPRPRLAPRVVHDRLGRVLEARDPAGRTQRWSYRHSTHPVAHVDADGKRRTREVGRWALITAERDGVGACTRYRYSPQEDVTAIVDPRGDETTYHYDAQDRLIRIERGDALEERYRYDARGRLVARLDAQGHPRVEIDYDARGLPVTRTLRDGGTHRLEYGPTGRVTVASTDRHEVRIDRDARGRVVRDLVDGGGVVHSDGGRWRTSTVLGRFVTQHAPLVESPPSTRTARTAVESTRIVDPSGAVHRVHHDDRGGVLREHPSGTRELSHYDDRGHCGARVLTRVDASGREHHRALRFGRTPEGDLIEEDDSERGVTRYEVDDAHRLVAERGPDGAFEYRYDEGGNLLAQPGLHGVEVGPHNQLRRANGEALAYDERFHLCERGPSGARVRYGYDSFDMLVRVDDGDGDGDGDVPWTAEYDAWGRRVQCGRGDAQTRFYWDGQRLAAEVSPEGALRVYVYPTPDAMQPLAFVDYDRVDADPADGRSYAVFYDAVGLPRSIEDGRGRVVWRAARREAYGAITVAPGAEVEFNLRWPGHYFDPQTGLHYNRFRYYCPTLGRYLQTDPSGQAGGINVYAYPGNPRRDVDVLGLSRDCTPTKAGSGGGGKKPHNPGESDLRKATKKQADELRGLPKKERPAVAAGMQTPDGTITSAGSHKNKGASGGKRPTEGAPQTKKHYDKARDEVQKPADWDEQKHGPWPDSSQSGNCAEAKNLANYEKEHGTLPPPGTKHDAATVRGQNSTSDDHGQPKPACPYCSHVQDQLGHTSDSGQSPYDVKDSS